MKLFLHIGSNKCGSTSLQNQLILNSESNNKHISLIENWGEEIGSARNLSIAYGSNLTYWKKIRNIDDNEIRNIKNDLYTKTHLEIEKKRQLGITNFIASSEHIFNFVDTSKKINDMADFLYKFFDEIIIVFYYRNQCQLIPSIWAQNINGHLRSTQSLSNYIDNINISSPANITPYSFLVYWKSKFDRLAFNTLDKQNLVGRSIFEDFSQITGFKFYNMDQIENQNISPSYSALNLLRVINNFYKHMPYRVFVKFYSFIKFLSNLLSHENIRHINARDLPKKCLIDNAKINKEFLNDKPILLPTKY